MSVERIIQFVIVVIALVLAFILLRELIDVIDDDTVASMQRLVLAAVTPMDVK